MAATRVGTYPIQTNNTTDAPYVTITYTPQFVGDLVVLDVVTNSPTTRCTGVSGGGCVSWTQVGTTLTSASGNVFSSTRWIGVISAAVWTSGAVTATASHLATPANSKITGVMFTDSTLRPNVSWTVDANHEQAITTATTVMAGFALTSTTTNGVAYAQWVPEGSGTAGPTSPWISAIDSRWTNVVSWRPVAATGTVAAASATSQSGRYSRRITLFSAAPSITIINGTAQAQLGGLSASAQGDRARNGQAEAQLGTLSAQALGVVTSVSADAELGALAATALGDVAHTATAQANLGTVAGLAQGQRETYAQMQAELGALLAEIEGEVHVSGTATTQLGRLSARMVADIDRPDVLLTGALPHVSFWAVGEDGTSLTPLPHVLDFELSRITNGVGSLQLTYPTIGQNYALLRAIVDDQRQLPVEIWIGGTPTSRMRGILVEAEGDDTEESSTWTFAGHFDEFRMRDALLAPNPTPGDDWKTWFDNETPGTVMATLLLAAQDRGTLTDITISFTDTHDSNGVEWTQAVNLELAPHRAYDDILADLVDAGVCEWEVTPEHELRLYEPGTRGIDRTTAPVPTILRVGGGLSQAKRKYTSREAGTDLFVAGGDGLYDSTHDDTARARYGRQIERSDSQNYILDDGALQAYAQNKIGAVASGAMELTVGLEFGAGRPQPSVAFNVGDWVYIDAGSGTMDRDPFERYRVEQWTLSGSGDELTGTVSVNDVFAQRIARLEKLVRGVAGGAVVIGASVQQPDTKPPAAPENVSASSLAYTDDQGQTLAAITVSWSPVTQNSDGTALFDLSGYYVRYRYLDDTGPDGYQDAGRQSQGVSTVQTFSGVLAGTTVGVSVQAYDRSGFESDWSSEFVLLAGADATPPPVPSVPAVSNYIGLLRTDWDGLGSVGEAMPVDFDRVEILASQVDDFTEADEHTVIGTLRGESAYPWSPPGSLGNVDYDVTWFVKLRSVDKSGNVSALSEQGSAVPGQVAEGDIASVNIGQLTAGIMNALMIVGQKIATGTTGSRVEIDGGQGLFCINSDDEVVFSYDIDDEILQMIGRFIAGSPDGNGARVVLDPAFVQPGGFQSFPSLLAYSDNGLQGPARINATDQPTSGTGHTALGLNSGPTDDDTTYEQTTMFLWPTQAYLSVNAGGGGVEVSDRRGGAMVLSKNGAGIEYSPNGVTRSFFAADANGSTIIGRNTSGVERSSVVANADGSVSIIAATDVGIYGPNGTKLELNSNGSVRLGGTGNGYIDITTSGDVEIHDRGVLLNLKNFIIDHPIDPDRWLIHACAEGPVAELLYSGEATIRNGRAIVELPSYFEAASRIEGRQVQLTPVDELCMVAASRIVGGRFIIKCSGDDGTVVQWRVIATRADVEQFPVEPLKSEVNVRGDGPYRYIVSQSKEREREDG